MASKRMIDPETLKHFEILCSNGNKYLLLPYEHLADVPMVDAVEVPNCEECFWNGNIRGWAQCEHCIGNTSGTNNFLHKNKVTDDGK